MSLLRKKSSTNILKVSFTITLLVVTVLSYSGLQAQAQNKMISPVQYDTRYRSQNNVHNRQNQLYQHRNDSFVIQGSNFQSSHEVIIQGINRNYRTSGSSSDGRTLVITNPPDINAGTYNVIVFSPRGEQVFSNIRINPLPQENPLNLSKLKDLSLPRPCWFDVILCPDQPDAHEIQYVAIGDSLAAGLVAFRGYVPRYEEHIEDDNGLDVDWVNRGVSGWKSSDLLHALQSNVQLQNEIAQAEVITWNVGGNDLLTARALYKAKRCGGPDNQECLRVIVDSFKHNWNGIVQQIIVLQQRNTEPTIIRSMNLYYPHVTEDMSSDTWLDDGANDFEILNRYLAEANLHIAKTLHANYIPYADVWLAFNGVSRTEDPAKKGIMSSDGIHPNDSGHRLIAGLLRQQGYRELSAVPVVRDDIVYPRELTPEPLPITANTPEPIFGSIANPQPLPNNANTPQPLASGATNPQPLPSSANTPEPIFGSIANPQPLPNSANTPVPVWGSMANPQPLPNSANTPEPIFGNIANPEPLPGLFRSPQPLPGIFRTPQPLYLGLPNPQPLPGGHGPRPLPGGHGPQPRGGGHGPQPRPGSYGPQPWYGGVANPQPLPGWY